MIYIVIPVFNRLQFTINCLNSLQAQSYPNYRVIIVDDGSTDNTAAWLMEHYSDVLVLKGDGNLWWTGATNLGVQKAMELSDNDNDFILTLNNDLEVKSDYLQQLVTVASEHPKALVGSVSVDFERPDIVHFAGTKWNSATAKYRPVFQNQLNYRELVDAHPVVHTDLLPGRGVLVPISIFRKIGFYDQVAFPHYMADEDFSLRAKRHHYELLIATKAVVYNHVNETGLKKQSKNLKYYRDVFTSIKSPVNFTNRWNWARKHGQVPAVYFIIDIARILKGVLSKA